eukprot:scaffold1952_cov25-Tisochrysis_lutea.AAC.1
MRTATADAAIRLRIRFVRARKRRRVSSSSSLSCERAERRPCEPVVALSCCDGAGGPPAASADVVRFRGIERAKGALVLERAARCRTIGDSEERAHVQRCRGAGRAVRGAGAAAARDAQSRCRVERRFRDGGQPAHVAPLRALAVARASVSAPAYRACLVGVQHLGRTHLTVGRAAPLPQLLHSGFASLGTLAPLLEQRLDEHKPPLVGVDRALVRLEPERRLLGRDGTAPTQPHLLAPFRRLGGARRALLDRGCPARVGRLRRQRSRALRLALIDVVLHLVDEGHLLHLLVLGACA